MFFSYLFFLSYYNYKIRKIWLGYCDSNTGMSESESK
nr:MAG TPA: Man1-Src1p-C-terminal domain [Caudoviricetes sp.]